MVLLLLFVAWRGLAAIQAGSTAPNRSFAGRLVASLVFEGPKGEVGSTGATGSQGAQGVPGVQGATGLQGSSGVANCPYGNCVSLQPNAPGTTENGNISVLGTITAASFQGNGMGLSSINAVSLQGYGMTYLTNASNLSSGTLADAHLSPNVALLNAGSWNFGGNLTVSGSTQLASLHVSGVATLASISVTGNASIGGSLTYGTTLSGSCANLPGYIWVPGSSKYGTLPGFCVMKYTASSADGNTGSTNYGAGEAVSTGALPWVSISQRNAETAAQAACTSGCHLITEPEWMTIAENALWQPANWTGGTVGSGALYSGHNDNAPANALAAHAGNDTNGYYGETNTGGNQRRTLWLSTGNGPCLNNGPAANSNCEAIWDIAGNVYQWTDAWILGSEEPTITGSEGFAWRQYTSITKWAGLAYAMPTNRGWNTTQGLGEIYSDGTSTNAGQYGFLRGGGWNIGGSAGAFALYLSLSPAYAGAIIGFRVSR